MTAHDDTPKSILLARNNSPLLNHRTIKPVVGRSVLAARTLPLQRHAAVQQKQQQRQQTLHLHHHHQPLLLCNIRNRYANRRPSMLPPRGGGGAPPVLLSTLLVSEDDEATTDDDDSIDSSSESSNVETEQQQQEEEEQRRRVRFAKSNQVFTIPNRRDYSDEDKRALFHGKKELRRMVAKNHTEHAFEGRNWREAPEEQDFVTDASTGQSLHPVHAAELVQKSQAAAAAAVTTPSPHHLLPRKRLVQRRRVVDRQRSKRRRISVDMVNVSDATAATTDPAVKDTEDEELSF